MRARVRPLATAALLFGTAAVWPAARAQVEPFSVPLPIPPVRTEADITLTMQEADVPILPGAPTRMWTYDGVFPGPTIRRPSGEPTRVTFRNLLPAAAGSMTVHHHGNHSPWDEDGHPTEFLIPPGQRRTYTYDFMEAGEPERAAFQWYHDHRMEVTGRNVWMGLAGMVILDDPVDAALPLPKGAQDVPLMIADRTFDADNQIPYTFDVNGAFGDTVLVNGAVQPYLEVADRRYRFRILNASNFRNYQLSLSNGEPMVQIATESGLLPAPVSRTSIRVDPAERVEVVVDFAGHLGEDITLFGSNAQIVQFRVRRDETEDSSVPAVLRPAPRFPLTRARMTRTWVLGLQADHMGLVWTINGRGFDPERVDTAPLNPVLGTVERWVFLNASPGQHVVHIHDVDWRIVSRSGGAPPPEEQGLKETFLIVPGETVEVASAFTDHTGRWVFHCHILEHEDRAMMAQFEVVEG